MTTKTHWQKFTILLLLPLLTLLLAACGAGPGAEIVSAEYVDSINTGGVSYKYQGQDIVQLKLDFSFDEEFAAGLDPDSEEFRQEIFSKLADCTHFYHDGEEIERIYGYWPAEAGSDYAKEMSLFYLVPDNHSRDSLNLVVDGDMLGEGGERSDMILDIR